jgi:ABC-2 type transport system ATP-binding protein
MTSQVIQTQQLTRDFKTIRAVDNLSLQVEQGTIFGFLGPNGAGKTTTIMLFLGLLQPTSGTAVVLGYDTRTHASQIREKTGALLEHTGLYERLSAYDNLEFYGRVWHLSASSRASRIKELLIHLGLWERRQETVSTWSKGMKQKLAVARALLHHPELIFLDEPTAGLDPVAAAALRDDLATFATNEGVTVFLTTHNLNEAEKLCSRVAVIRAGKLLTIGAPDELSTGGHKLLVVGHGFTESVVNDLSQRPEVILAEIKNHELEITLRENTEAAPLVSLLVAQGVKIEEVHKQYASLEESFLALMEQES